MALTAGSVVILLLIIGLAWLRYYGTALALAAICSAVDTGVFYVLLRISEEAQKYPERYDAETASNIQELFHYSSAWMTFFGLLTIGLLIWIGVLDRQRKKLEATVKDLEAKAKTGASSAQAASPQYK